MLSTSARCAARVGAAALIASMTLGLAACSSGSSGSDEPDDGSTLTLWSRNQVDQEFAALYNETHENTVKVTVVPGDNFLQKVGSAAGSKSLPDVLTSDVVYAVNYASQGVYADVTERVDALEQKDDLVQAHVEAATVEDKVYGIPHFVDASMLFYNKDLFRAAGLDPDQFPTDFDQLYEAAAAIDQLGDDTSGFALPNTPGGWAYQAIPSLAASGEPPFTDDGAKVHLDTDAMKTQMSFYQRLSEEGILPGTTRSDLDAGTYPLITDGKIGIGWAGNWFGGSFGQEIDFDWGLAPWPAVDGGATGGFVGGDVIGVTAGSKHQEQAWDFIEWTLSADAQRQVLGKNGLLPVLTSLGEDETWTAIPDFDRMTTALTDGYTPSSLPYGEIFNTPTGPWFRNIEAIVFEGADVDSSLATMQQEAQDVVDGAYGK